MMRFDDFVSYDDRESIISLQVFLLNLHSQHLAEIDERSLTFCDRMVTISSSFSEDWKNISRGNYLNTI
jgi:hypothetical protein